MSTSSEPDQKKQSLEHSQRPSSECRDLVDFLKTRDRQKLRLETTVAVCNDIAQMTKADSPIHTYEPFCRYLFKAMLDLLEHNVGTLDKLAGFNYQAQDAKQFRDRVVISVKENSTKIVNCAEEIAIQLVRLGRNEIGEEIIEKFEAIIKASKQK